MKIALTLILLYALIGRAQVSDLCLSQQDMTIVILGSSTAAGTGPSVSDSAWVNRYRTFLTDINPSNQVINLAQGGYTTYKSMPTAFVPPPGRPTPDNTKNIDAALSYNPDAIIINYPSNDASNGFGVIEQMGNFDSIANYAASFGVPVWIATTQPKTNLSAAGDSIQIGVRDSILSTYGSMAIDFWTTIADSNNDIEPQYDADGTHLNDAGHAILVSRVVAADIPSAIYVPPASPDYFIHSVYDESDLYCGESAEDMIIIVANAGNDDGIGYNVTSTITNLSSGQGSMYVFNFSSGLTTCEPDTIEFLADFSESGYYEIQTVISHPSDLNSTNDTLIFYTNVIEQPSILAINDTVCEGDSIVLSGLGMNADTVLWYTDINSPVPVFGGSNIAISNLINDTTLYVQAVKGPLVFIDSVNTNQTSNINWNGVMFDVIGLDNIVIDSLSCRLNSTGSQTVEVYYCNGSHIGQETNPGNWTLWHTETVNVMSAGDILMLHPGSMSLSINDTIGIYVMMQNPGSDVSYTSSGSTQSFYGQGMEVLAGSGANHNFGGSYFPRKWNGSLYSHYGYNPLGQCHSDLMPVSGIVSQPTLDLGPDTTITVSDVINIPAPGYTGHNWSDGSAGASLQFDAQQYGVGTHVVSVSAMNNHGCEETDTLLVTVTDPNGITAQTDSNVSIYPNPTSGIFQIETSSAAKVEIFNSSGALTHESIDFREMLTIDATGWVPGIYLARITDLETSYVSTQRLIISW